MVARTLIIGVVFLLISVVSKSQTIPSQDTLKLKRQKELAYYISRFNHFAILYKKASDPKTEKRLLDSVGYYTNKYDSLVYVTFAKP